jgi:predicted Fe-Mo cluster-binding NifX family protein
MSTIIAVPSEQPGGLDAGVGAHFGHCELYTLVKLDQDKVEDVQVIPNVPHQQGGCMAPVNYLAQNGVKKLIAGGMGMRPLMGFEQVGIDVFHGGGSATVGEAINAMVAGRLPQFSRQHTCGGGDHHQDGSGCSHG